MISADAISEQRNQAATKRALQKTFQFKLIVHIKDVLFEERHQRLPTEGKIDFTKIVCPSHRTNKQNNKSKKPQSQRR